MTAAALAPAVDEEMARETTRHLVGRLEGLVFVVQGVNIAGTAMIDKLLPSGRGVLLIIAAAHLVFAVLVYRIGGPFKWGGIWTVLWFGVIVLMPLVIGHLVAPTEYAASPSCVQLCHYPAPAVILFAFYPWMSRRHARLRLPAEMSMLAIIVTEPLLIVLATHDRPSLTNYTSVAASSVGSILGYMLGKTVGKMCNTAASKQVATQHEHLIELLRTKDEHHDEMLRTKDRYIFDTMRFLHVHAKSAIAAIRGRYGTDAAAIGELEEFDRAVWRRGLDVMLQRDRVPLDEYFQEHIRRFEHVIRESPRVGDIEASQSVAVMIDHALGDLIANAARHGRAVKIYFDVGGTGVATLDVVDDGPGFSQEILDDALTNLHRLRKEARDLGGDLVRLDESPAGSRLRLTVPMQTPNLEGR